MNLVEHFPILMMGLSFMPIAYFLGRLFFFWVKMDSFEWRGLLFQAMGFGVLSYLVTLFGLFGGWSPPFLWNLYWILLALGALTIFEWWGWVASLLSAGAGGRTSGEKILLFLAAVYFLILLSAALAPEYGTDALCYHLGTPKQLLEAGRLTVIPYDINSVFPFFLQMLYLFGLALKGVLIVKFFHLELALVLFFTFFLLLKEAGERRAFFWALLLMLTPGIVNQTAAAFTDIALAAYSFLAAVFLLKGVEEQKAALTAAGGIFFGFALAVKAIAAVTLFPLLAAALLAACLQPARPRKFPSLARGILFFVLSLAGAACFWYLRAYWITGNPFYPYFNRFFHIASIPGAYEVKGMGIGWLEFLKLPWNLTVHFESFGNRSDQIGPVYLILLPFLAWGLFTSARSRVYALAGLGSVVFWFFLAQRSRFLYPILPLVLCAEVFGFKEFQQRFPRIGALFRGLVGVVLLGLFALAVYHYRHHLNLASGLWSDADFRTSMERSAVVTDFVNERLPFGDVPMGAGPVKILNAEEIHRFYFEKQVVREGLFGLETRYWETLKTPAEVVAFLKARGFTHVLLAHPAGRMGTWPPLRIRALVRDPRSGALYFEKVFEARSKNQEGQVYDYALYRIK